MATARPDRNAGTVAALVCGISTEIAVTAAAVRLHAQAACERAADERARAARRREEAKRLTNESRALRRRQRQAR